MNIGYVLEDLFSAQQPNKTVSHRPNSYNMDGLVKGSFSVTNSKEVSSHASPVLQMWNQTWKVPQQQKEFVLETLDLCTSFHI